MKRQQFLGYHACHTSLAIGRSKNEVDVDNGYLGEDRQRTLPLLLAKDPRTLMHAGTAVASKGHARNPGTQCSLFCGGFHSPAIEFVKTYRH